MGDRLGGTIARRPLHFFWILDLSSSMAEADKIDALNFAIRETIPHLRSAAAGNPHVQVLVRVLGFATTARWVTGAPVPVEQFEWSDLSIEPDGLTELGSALHEMALEMAVLSETGRGMAPVMVLVSDGRPTTTAGPSFRAGLEELMAQPWGEKAHRFAIGVGKDADPEVLRRFIGHAEIPLVQAGSPERLVSMLRWASTVAVQSSDPGVAPAVLQPPWFDDDGEGDEPLIWDVE